MIAAETMNLMYEVVAESSIESEIEFLFDVITPGFQSPDMWAEEAGLSYRYQSQFTNGKSEIVKVMTSDLEENGTLEPSGFTDTMVKELLGVVTS